MYHKQARPTPTVISVAVNIVVWFLENSVVWFRCDYPSGMADCIVLGVSTGNLVIIELRGSVRIC